MSDAIGLINTLLSLNGSTSMTFLETFSIETRGSSESKIFSCGTFSYGLLYIQSYGTYSSSPDYAYSSDSCIFISPNMSSVYIYSKKSVQSSDGTLYNGDSCGSISSTSNSITINVYDDYHFMTGSIICFN